MASLTEFFDQIKAAREKSNARYDKLKGFGEKFESLGLWVDQMASVVWKCSDEQLRFLMEVAVMVRGGGVATSTDEDGWTEAMRVLPGGNFFVRPDGDSGEIVYNKLLYSVRGPKENLYSVELPDGRTVRYEWDEMPKELNIVAANEPIIVHVSYDLTKLEWGLKSVELIAIAKRGSQLVVVEKNEGKWEYEEKQSSNERDKDRIVVEEVNGSRPWVEIDGKLLRQDGISKLFSILVEKQHDISALEAANLAWQEGLSKPENLELMDKFVRATLSFVSVQWVEQV